MALYGAMHPKYTPFAAGATEPATGLPTYDNTKAVTLAELVSVNANPNISESTLYGDNRAVEYVAEFTEGSIDVGVTDMTPKNAGTVYGSTFSEENGVTHTVGDEAPYGCFSFIRNVMVNGKKLWEPHFYPKVKAKPGQLTANTKNGTITFETPSLNFKWLSTASGVYEKWDRFETEAAAEAYIAALDGSAEDGDDNNG